MKVCNARALVHVGSPRVGSETRRLFRELARVGGVRGVVSGTRIPRLLAVYYDSNVTQARTLVQYVKRSWSGARLV